MTLSRRGTYANLGLPGTGLSWRGRIDGGKGRQRASAEGPSVSKATQTKGTTMASRTGASALDAALRKAKARFPYLGGGLDGARTQAMPEGEPND
jgi:hypothetical protein